MKNETIFEKILRKEIPAQIVFEDEWVLAFKDINPQAPVHVLVIPKNKYRHVGEFANATVQEAGEYLRRIALVAEKLGLTENGYRVVFNTGGDGQQSVDYVHAHILGGRQMEWPPG